jgi:beta-N-acetylhexosaminidase
MGTRTFGDDPEVAGRMATEMIEGLQASGVAATIKHFPGHGSAAADSHVELPIVDAELDSLRRRELVPFAAAIRARPRLAMVAHVAVPGITGDASLPATFAPAVVGLLRGDLGFGGVVISDALNMGALGPLEDAAVHVVRAAAAGLDLCLMLHTPDVEERSTDVLAEAITDGRVDRRAAEASAERVGTLRRWLDRRASDRATLDEVGAPEHRALAREIAERSVTLVGDRHGLLPLRASVDRPLLVVVPRPVDLTPADTSSYLRVGLADELRVRGLRADELVLPLDPTTADVAAIVHRAAGRTVVIGTVDATVHRGQAAVVDALIAHDVPVVAVALRTPFDVAAYARVGAYACTYGIQPPSIEALADALVGRIPFRGRLPVTLAVPAAAA